MRPSLTGLFLIAAACFSACQEGAIVCPTGELLCDGACIKGFACPSSGVGGSTSVPTTLTPVDPGPYTSPDCTDTSTSTGNFATQYGGATLTTNTSKTYYLHTNWWNKYAGETVTYQGLSFTVANPTAATTSDNNPLGYPSLFIGSYSGHTTAGSNLPKQVSALTTVPTVFSTNAADGTIANHNAAYDVWFTDTSAPLASSAYSPPPGGAFLMVWMFKPTGRQPRGNPVRTGATVAGVDGQWNVWVDNSSPPCISYVSTNPRNGLAFDLNAFIKDSVAFKLGITNSMYLSIIFAGFEIWGGANGIQVKNFCAKVN